MDCLGLGANYPRAAARGSSKQMLRSWGWAVQVSAWVDPLWQGPAVTSGNQRTTARLVRSDGLKAVLAKGARWRGRVLKQPNAPNGDTKALGAPAGSEGKESAYSEGDPGSIPASARPGRSCVGKIAWRGNATHFSILAWRIPWQEEPGRLQSWGCKESVTTEWLHFHFSLSLSRDYET